MKKILVPVDLSEGSENAVKIASKLSLQTNAKVVIIHIVNPPRGAVLLEDGTVKDDNEYDLTTFYARARETMDLIKEKFGSIPNVECVVKIGGVNEIILHELEVNQFDLLILGMTGELATSFWSNSHTEYLSKHVKTPVLTLKCDRSKMSFDKIIFVSDFLESDQINLEILRSLADHFNSKLVLLKIVTKDQRRSDQEILDTAQQFAENNHLTNFEIVIHKDASVEEGIATYANQNYIDLIAIGTHQRGGFSTLFRRSVSQNIVRTLYHPIITIPIA